ncbi:hypothetical protein [Niveispirillum sp. KHB5.9]|uniref:hypothetical protein n=1 Tax=Niveispirillum sp. KHB5.9 TaxID=3400269 RepID=UPI003A845BE0
MRMRNIPAVLAVITALPAGAAPADDFLARLNALCGKAFEGRIVDNTAPNAANDPFAGKVLTMHVRECGKDQVKIPFHVGDDRSRTWVVTRTADGLRLKHDHRHKDGSEDAVTQYGGDTATPGTAERQEFPVDAFSKAMFTQQKLPPGAQQNVWAMEVRSGDEFVYELSRPDRLFRVSFDLNRPVTPPPAPWGHQ